MSLEGVWQEDWQPEEEHGTSGMNKQQVLPSSLAAATFGSPVHMQLFYDQVNGQAQQQEQDATEDDADSFMPPPPPRHMQQTQQQQHHMAMEAHHEQ